MLGPARKAVREDPRGAGVCCRNRLPSSSLDRPIKTSPLGCPLAGSSFYVLSQSMDVASSPANAAPTLVDAFRFIRMWTITLLNNIGLQANSHKNSRTQAVPWFTRSRTPRYIHPKTVLTPRNTVGHGRRIGRPHI